MIRTSEKLLALWLAIAVGLFACAATTAQSQNTPFGLEKGSSYFPLSVGNWWRYTFDRHSKSEHRVLKWSVTQKEEIGGYAVYHLWQTPAQGDEPLSLSETRGGVLEADTDRFVLKNPVHAGDRWTSTPQSIRAKGKLDSFEVVSSGTSCSVLGRSFKDCATIRESDEANNIETLTTYASGVGPIKYVYFKGVRSNEVEATLEIKSWSVH